MPWHIQLCLVFTGSWQFVLAGRRRDVFGPQGFQPDLFVATIIAFVIAVTIHEFMHAWSALQLGDDTAYMMGRVTLNPASHFDPLGFVLMVFLALGIGVIAWGRPVPININRLRGGKAGYALTALAGPASNLVLAGAMMLSLRLSGTELTGFAGLLASQIVFINLLLAAFNVIPIPPLDGSKILTGILPNFWFPYMRQLEQYGFAILLVLIMVGYFFSGNILFAMYQPVFDLLWDVFVGSFNLTGFQL